MEKVTGCGTDELYEKIVSCPAAYCGRVSN